MFCASQILSIAALVAVANCLPYHGHAVSSQSIIRHDEHAAPSYYAPVHAAPTYYAAPISHYEHAPVIHAAPIEHYGAEYDGHDEHVSLTDDMKYL